MIHRKYWLLGFLISCSLLLGAQAPLHKKTPTWFKEAKFGVFIHFAAHGHFVKLVDKDKVKGKEMNPEVYPEGAKAFTLSPEHVEHWTKKISEWGARYAVLTTKHRPGFSLWDTQVNDRNIVKMSPAGFDVVEAWTRGLRKHKVKVGLYFSHYDWGDPDFTLAKSEGVNASKKKRLKAWLRYLPKRDQSVEELVTRYGQIDLIWWDEDWCAKDYKELGSDPLLDMVFSHQPEVVINNRARHPWRWHYGTPEKFVPLRRNDSIPWEACDNLINGNGWGFGYPYGYPRESYRSKEEILLTFLDVISRGGNYLLNIGPRPDGKIPEIEEEILDYVGSFVRQNGEAIYGTQSGLPATHFAGASTRKGKVLYLFATHSSLAGTIVKGIKTPPLKVSRLRDSKPIAFHLSGGRPGHGRPAWIVLETSDEGANGKYPEVYKLEFESEPEWVTK